MEKLLLDAKEVHELANISLRNAYRLLNRSDLPVVRIGERRYMHRALFEEWLRDEATKKNASEGA